MFKVSFCCQGQELQLSLCTSKAHRIEDGINQPPRLIVHVTNTSWAQCSFSGCACLSVCITGKWGVCVQICVCTCIQTFFGGAPCKVGFKFNGILLCVSTDMASGVNSLAFNTSGIRPIDPTAVAAHHAQWVKQTIH